MKILNLYAGIGGNRKLWKHHEVTAVEQNRDIARVYVSFFPEDTMIVTDAHAFLLDHFAEYDFIWSSPPCQSYSSMRQNLAVRYRGTPPMYPDMRLYQEILLLRYNFDGRWVVENVNPFYTPLIEPSARLGRHLVWCNFPIQDRAFDDRALRSAQIPDLEDLLGFDLSVTPLPNKRQVLRNCVLPELGLHVLQEAGK